LEHRLSQRVLLGRPQPSLEKQAMAAWTGGNMASAKADEIVAKTNALGGYKQQFQRVFQSDATPDNDDEAICGVRAHDHQRQHAVGSLRRATISD
jgi:hypothetical protein